MAIRTDYNEIFADMLATLGFSLERTQDGSFVLYDNQLDKYRGDDDGLARFISASDIIEELDLYIEGSFSMTLKTSSRAITRACLTVSRRTVPRTG